MKLLRWLLFPFILLGVGPIAVLIGGDINMGQDWRTASRASANIAPDPAQTREAVIQVYAARAFNWRGIFGVHTWIATKPENSDSYAVHQVIGWHAWQGRSVVASGPDTPDRLWYGQRPEIIFELRGAAATEAIPAVFRAVETYPYPKDYGLWPGPNSNSFTAHVARQVPQLKVDLPPTAIGKDYLASGSLWARTPSGTGFQISVFGLFGVLVAATEGLEFNVLGACFGIDPLDLAIKLPGVGRLALL